MHDPIGNFCRIRDLYISYLDTAFRLGDKTLEAERRALLKTAGTLCTDPLFEPVLRYRPMEKDGKSVDFDDIRKGQLDTDGVFKPEDWSAIVDLILAGLFPSKGATALNRTAAYPPYEHQVKMLQRGIQTGQPGSSRRGQVRVKPSRSSCLSWLNW